jgi:hypothetical protein
VALGQKLDIVFALIRIGFFTSDNAMVAQYIDKAKTYVNPTNHRTPGSPSPAGGTARLPHAAASTQHAFQRFNAHPRLIEVGGDWDRRNRLKVYEGVYRMAIRDFDRAAKLFNDTVSTFTSVELVDYATFVSYAVLTSALALDRVDLAKKVGYIHAHRALAWRVVMEPSCMILTELTTAAMVACHILNRINNSGDGRMPYTPDRHVRCLYNAPCILMLQVIASPEMHEVAQERPIVRDYVKSLYDCDYGAFFRALGVSP